MGANVRAFLSKLWRVPATGFGFLVFFTGGILFRLCVFPSLNLFISDARKRELKARKVVQVSFAFFIRLLGWLQVLKLDLDPALKHRLSCESLFVCASHPTLIDVVLLMSKIPNARARRSVAGRSKSFRSGSPPDF